MEITTRSRIHVTLLGLSPHGYRKNGGAGFFVNHPNLHIVTSKSRDTNLNKLNKGEFSPDDVEKLSSRLSKIREAYKLERSIRVDSISCAGSHIGLGTGTSLAMACVEALFLNNGIAISESELVKNSGRGGTSGIGINGYLRGGFIVDTGVPLDNNSFAPSDDIDDPAHVPKILARSDMPDWPIGILIPENKKGIPLALERALFSSNTPILMDDVYRQTYNVIFGALAAVACNDLCSFFRSLKEIQSGKWKSSEIALHAPKITQEMERLYLAGCDAVGLSSAGPSLYFMAENFKLAADNIKEVFGHTRVIETFPCNSGRIINA